MYTHTEVEVVYSTMDIPYIDHEDADVPIQVILETTLFLCCLTLLSSKMRLLMVITWQ